MLTLNLYRDGLVQKGVANDYDHFFDDYEKYLDYKDWIVKSCIEHGIKPRKDSGHYSGMTAYYYDDNGKRQPINLKLNDEEQAYLQSLIAQVPKKYWDYLVLGSNFVYRSIVTARKYKIGDFKYFKSYLKTDKQRAYLKALNEITLEHLDYKDFLEKYKEEIKSKRSLVIIDPPYVDTNQEQYKGSFDEAQTKELVAMLNDLGCDFIFYNHDEDKVVEWLKDYFDFWVIPTCKPATTSNGKRRDIMAYVKR